MPRGVPEAFRPGATAEPSVSSISLSHECRSFGVEFAPGAAPDINNNNYNNFYVTIPRRRGDVPDFFYAGAVSAPLRGGKENISSRSFGDKSVADRLVRWRHEEIIAEVHLAPQFGDEF